MARKKAVAAPEEVPMSPLNTLVPTNVHRAVKVAAINAGKTLQQFVAEVLGEKVGVAVPPPPERSLKKVAK